MKNSIVFIALIGITLFMSSCTRDIVSPSELITKVNKNIFEFDKISVSGEFEVYVTFSEFEESIEIEANENLHELIKVEKRGNKLVIGMERNTSIRGNNEVLRVYISTKSIKEFQASGESKINLQNELKADNLKIDLTGESKFEGQIDLDKLEIDANGASSLNLVGKVRNLDGKYSGASRMENFDLEVNDIKLKLTGDSKVSNTTNSEIFVTALGNSRYYYKGDAKVVFELITGDSKVEKVD